MNKGKILSIVYLPKKNFPLPKNSQLNLYGLASYCESKGVSVKRGKSGLIVNLSDSNFQIYSSGKVGVCYVKSLAKLEELDYFVFDFFWHGFAKQFIEKKVEAFG